MIGCDPLYNLVWMMLRVKQQHVTTVDNRTDGRGKGWSFGLATLCYSVSLGIILILSQVSVVISPAALIPSLVVAAITSILSGLCLTEFLTSQCQGVRSVYSCFYQSSCELLAFLVGWTSLLSASALASLTTRILSATIDEISHNGITKFLQSSVSASCPDLLSVALTLGLSIMSLTGIKEAFAWFAVVMPILFSSSVALSVLLYVVSSQGKWPSLSTYEIRGPDELLTGAALCALVFIGPQSIFRIHPGHIHQKVSGILGPLNAVCFVFTFMFTVLLAHALRFVPAVSSPTPLLKLFLMKDCVGYWYAIGILYVISLCLLTLESYHPFHSVIQDMASDGLLFRGLSKVWTPFCFQVHSPYVHLLAVMLICSISVALSIECIMKVAAYGTLLINSLVCLLVLLQRYQDRDSWQYEPMLQTSTKRFAHSRTSVSKSFTTSTENPGCSSQAEKTSCNTCVDGESDHSSDTDIDAVVQEYKEHVQVKNLMQLDNPITETLVKEPTPVTNTRAKLCVMGVLISYLTLALLVTVACRVDKLSNLIFLSIQILCIMVALVLLCILSRLPENKHCSLFSNKPQSRVPLMPWIPGIAGLLTLCLVVHTLVDIWQIVVTWTLIGIFLYLVYGIQSSTAASSFHHMHQTPAQLSLQPLPSQDNCCVPQLIPSHRRFGLNKKRRSPDILLAQTLKHI